MEYQDFAYIKIQFAMSSPDVLKRVMANNKEIMDSYLNKVPLDELRPLLETFLMPEENSTDISTQTLMQRVIFSITVSSKGSKNTEELFDDYFSSVVCMIKEAHTVEHATLRRIAIICGWEICRNVAVEKKIAFVDHLIDHIIHNSRKWLVVKFAYEFFHKSCEYLGSHYAKHVEQTLEYIVQSVHNNSKQVVISRGDHNEEIEDAVAAIRTIQCYVKHFPMSCASYTENVLHLLENQLIRHPTNNVKFACVEALVAILWSVSNLNVAQKTFQFIWHKLNHTSNNWDSTVGKLTISLNMMKCLDILQHKKYPVTLAKALCQTFKRNLKNFFEDMDRQHYRKRKLIPMIGQNFAAAWYIELLGEISDEVTSFCKMYGSEILIGGIEATIPQFEELLKIERMPADNVCCLKVFTSMIRYCSEHGIPKYILKRQTLARIRALRNSHNLELRASIATIQDTITNSNMNWS